MQRIPDFHKRHRVHQQRVQDRARHPPLLRYTHRKLRWSGYHSWFVFGEGGPGYKFRLEDGISWLFPWLPSVSGQMQIYSVTFGHNRITGRCKIQVTDSPVKQYINKKYFRCKPTLIWPVGAKIHRMITSHNSITFLSFSAIIYVVYGSPATKTCPSNVTA